MAKVALELAWIQPSILLAIKSDKQILHRWKCLMCKSQEFSQPNHTDRIFGFAVWENAE